MSLATGLSSSGWQPRAVTVIFIILGISWTPLTNNLEVGFSYLAVEFLLVYDFEVEHYHSM